jgi:HEAT repeat protein
VLRSVTICATSHRDAPWPLRRETVVPSPTDVFDPSCAPGVATPSWGGLSAREGIEFLRGLVGLDIIAVDVNTVSPPHDVQNMTAFLAAQVIYESLVISDLAAAARHPLLQVRQIAIRILGDSSRDEAEIAVPALVEALADDNPQWAAKSLSSIGRPAALALVAVLDRPAREPARFAVEALVGIGADAVPELIAALGHPSPRTRRRAGEALSRLGPRVAGKLGAALLSAGVEVRRGAAAVLKKLGTADSVLEPDLIISLGHRLPDVRQRAREALRRLGSTAIPLLVDALGQPAPPVRKLALQGLKLIGPLRDEAIWALVAALGDKEEEIRHEAVALLRTSGSGGGPSPNYSPRRLQPGDYPNGSSRYSRNDPTHYGRSRVDTYGSASSRNQHARPDREFGDHTRAVPPIPT